MSEHYFSASPHSKENTQLITTRIGSFEMEFLTDAGVFSKHRVDFGSRVLVESFLDSTDYKVFKGESIKVLELGSGYGPIILSLAKALPSAKLSGLELNQRAVALSIQNAFLNHVTNVSFESMDVCQLNLTENYDLIFTNPPIRAGKQVVHTFVDKAINGLKKGGQLWLVIQKKQGAPSLVSYMKEQFSQVERVNLEKGYWVIKAEKSN